MIVGGRLVEHVPGSIVAVASTGDAVDPERVPEWPARIQVRCTCCSERLFDLITVASPALLGVRFVLERRCPGCHLDNRTPVTWRPGEPAPGGVNGHWYCRHCRRFLANIDADLGRVRSIPCRGKSVPQPSVLIHAAVLAGHRHYARRVEVESRRLA